jgi:YegS/Rv2252/BmrU family lipid kinase
LFSGLASGWNLASRLVLALLSPRLLPRDRRKESAVRTCVIFNPAAKGGKARSFRQHLDEFAAVAALKQTTAVGDARRLAAEAVRQGFEIVVAAGGDGTLNEVLNGIGDIPDGFERARLGVLPLGTVNVFARELGIPIELEPAWNAIRQGRETLIDLPCAECNRDGVLGRHYFGQLAGAGLDARAIELVNWRLKKRIGPFAYVVAGLQALMGPQAKITVTDGQRSITGELVLIGNGRLYGGPFAVFPKADLRDGLLEVQVVPRASWLTLFRVAPGLLLRRRLPSGVAESFQAATFTLTSVNSAAMEVDGEFLGHLPAKFSTQRLRLRVTVP